MKKRGFRCLGILLTPVLAFAVGLCCAGTLHAAEASVEYRGQAEQIVFLPDGDDLFLNFKGMMPGDRREQAIQLANRSDQTVSIDLEALPPDAADQAFLKWFNLRVLRASEVISDAEASETGGLGHPVRLAILKPGETAELTAELVMDSAADGSVQGMEAGIRWVFTAAEEAPAPTTAPTTAPTAAPTTAPTTVPTTAPTAAPTTTPTAAPTAPTKTMPSTSAAPLPRTGGSDQSGLAAGGLLLLGICLAAGIYRRRQLTK